VGVNPDVCPACGPDEAEEKPIKGGHPNKVFGCTVQLTPMNNAHGLLLLEIPDGCLWFVVLVQSLCVKSGGWGISPSAEGDQRAPPFGNLPLSRKRPKLLIRG